MQVKIYQGINISKLLAVRQKENNEREKLSNRQSGNLCKSGRDARKDSTTLSEKAL